MRTHFSAASPAPSGAGVGHFVPLGALRVGLVLARPPSAGLHAARPLPERYEGRSGQC